ncbi:MAG: hypothetical protein ACNYZH_05395 [Acidimicrobiia bacterium]
MLRTQPQRRVGRYHAIGAVILAVVLVAIPAGAQESDGTALSELLAGEYVGTLTFWANVSGLGPDGAIATYSASGAGPVSMTMTESDQISGTWVNDFNSVMTLEQQGGSVRAVNQMHDEGTFKAAPPHISMSGTQTGLSTVTIDSGVGEMIREISVGPQPIGPITLERTFVDCNQLWHTFAPSIEASAKDIGWKTRRISGSIMIVPVDSSEREVSIMTDVLNIAVREAMADLFAWAATARAAASAGEQPDIRAAQGPIAQLEWVNEKLDHVARCDPGKAKDQALWRSQITDAIRDELNAILGHSPADVTFTPETLNDMATVGARAAALGEGATDTSGGLAGNIQSAAAVTAAAGGDSDGLARLDARLGSGT